MPFTPRRCAFLALTACMALTDPASAELLERDLVPGSGDAYLTLDTESGLEWLDLGLTHGLSASDILDRVGNDWLDQDFSYATGDEMCDLWRHAGHSFLPCPSPQTVSMPGIAWRSPLVDLLGGFEPGLVERTFGVFDDPTVPGCELGYAWLQANQLTGTTWLLQRSPTFSCDEAVEGRGHFLVRVPEPTGGPLQLTAIAVLFALRKRRAATAD